MGVALELLTNAKSQICIYGPLGKFLQYLARQIDDLTGGGVGSQFFQAKNSGAQAIGGATNIVVDQDIAARGITRISANTFQLTPGKTYLLEAHGRFTGFAAATDAIQFRWVDETETSLPPTGPDAVSARVLPMTSTQADSNLPMTSVIYTAGTGPQSQVRVRAHVVTGSATIPANGFQITITEIPG